MHWEEPQRFALDLVQFAQSVVVDAAAEIHVAGRTHLMRETMARLEARLDPKRFVRIHRSTIVNIDRLRKLTPTFAGEYVVVLHDGTKLKLSRGYHDRIATLLEQSL